MTLWTLYRTLSWRYLQQRWSRAALVVASIALGVATLVATRTLNLSMREAARQSSRPLAGLTDLHVTNGDAGVPLALAAEVGDVPGVRTVLPLLVERVLLTELNNRPVLLVGVELSPDSVQSNPWGITYSVTDPLRAWQLGRRAVFAGQELAAELGQQLPDGARVFHVLASGAVRELPRWVGTVNARGPAATLGGHVLYLDSQSAGHLLGRPGLVTRLDLTLETGADPGEVRARLDELLSGRALVQTPEASDQSVHQMMNGLQIGFTFSGYGALVVGLFLVYNVLSVSVAERRHEIGILRALGATRGQVRGLFVGEAAILGLAGAAAGVPAGFGLARLGLSPMQKVFSDLFAALEARTVVVTADTVLLAVLAGLATAVVAVLVPATRSAAEQPADAVRRVPTALGLAYPAVQITLGVLLISAGLLCLLSRERLPARVGTHGFLALALLGALLLTPLAAFVLARLLQPPARRWLGIAGRLAADNLVRAPARTGLVITALTAGVAMVLQTAGYIRSNHDVVLGWVDQSLLADLFVTAGSPVSGSGQNASLPEDLGRQWRAADSRIAAAVAARLRQVDFRGRKVFLIALDADAYYQACLTRNVVAGMDLYPRLAGPGTAKVIVSENFAALYGVAPGDTFELRGPRGPVPLQVVGTLEDYSWHHGTIILDRGSYRDQFGDALVDVYDLFLEPGCDAQQLEAVREHVLRRWGPEYALVVLNRVELRQRIQGIIDRLFILCYSQEVVVALVAALGVVSALLISVMQRRGELGVLRAVGATRAQVLRSVLAEAAFMGLIGTALGLLVGLPIEWFILRVILFEEAGFRFPMTVPWSEAVVIAGLAVALATLAGLVPALHTLRLRIPEAIAYE